MASGARSRSSALSRMQPALDRVEDIVFRISEHGLQRATPATIRELQAVAQTAHHARLIRIEREVEGLTTQLRRYLGRDPSFHPTAFVSAANRVWLLVGQARRALRRAEDPADVEVVTGVPRRRYEPVPGTMEVVCVAASGWVTDSGYVGVTAHLYDAREERFVQASMVRPDRMVGPDPVRLLSFPVSEVTPITIQELCHGAWVLDDVRLSSDGRLSLHAGLSVAPGADPGRKALDPLSVGSADQILDRLEAGELDPVSGIGDLLVLIEPVAFGSVEIDDTHARATSRVRDAHGAVMRISVPVRPEHDVLIDNLQELAQPAWAPSGLVARATVLGGSLRITPLTAVYAEPVNLGRRIGSTHLVHLTVESLARARR